MTLDLFDTPPASPAAIAVPIGTERCARTIYLDPATFAQEAADGAAGERCLRLAVRAANAILDAQGSVCVWEVRIALGKLGLLANDGKERGMDSLGALGRRMGLTAGGSERPPAWAVSHLAVTHLNRGTRWYRPSSPQQRAAALEAAQATLAQSARSRTF